MKWVWGAIFLGYLIAVSLMTYYFLSDSYVDQDGVLVEEFWAWGLGVILILASVLATLIVSVRVLVKSAKTNLKAW